MDISSRERILNSKLENSNGQYIAIWLKRDFRFEDNWIFSRAIEYSNYYSVPIKVFFYLPDKLYVKNNPSKYCILYPSKRHLEFLFRSLKYLENKLNTHGIPFEFRTSNTPYNALKTDFNNSLFVLTDFKPTKPSIECDKNVSSKINVKIIQIDAHNIVPVWIASPNAEYMARTIRTKLWKKSDEFLVDYPKYTTFKQTNIKSKNPLPSLTSLNYIDDTFITNTKEGYDSGMKRFKNYLKGNIKNYDKRNDPTIENAQSSMSIYINYGTVSVQKMVYTLKKISTTNSKTRENIDDYIEEVWIRRELAENYCYYRDYESINSAWDWALKLMSKESNNNQLYSLKDMENANTEDAAWNAAQYQMISTGKMHGYMRMYWAKKIAEWSKNRQIALNIANYLNDKYEMDGSDSGGYTGTAWSIIGVHDRNFYGKFRPMTLAGLKSKKIDINKYIESNKI